MSSELSVSQDWNESQMQEFCVKVADGTHDSPKKTEQGKLLVTSKNIIGGTLDLTKSYRISEEDFNDVNRRSKVDINDVLLSMIGTVGEVCLIENEPDFAIKNVGLLKNHDPLKAKWLYFYLTSPLAQAQIKERLRGTTQQYLPLGEIRKFPIIYPESRTVMQEIVGVLAALQDKIQLNHQINQTLEQIAQAIFKSWFVDFEPVKAKIAALEADGSEEDALLASMQAISGKDEAQLNHLRAEQPEQYVELRVTANLFPASMHEGECGAIPEGWMVSSIGTEVEVKGGGTPPTKNKEYWEEGTIHWSSPKDLSNSQSKVMISTERKITEAGLSKISSGLLPEDTVLMSSRAPVGYLALAKIPVAINQGYIGMVCKKRLQPEYVIQWAASVMDDIKQRSSGTTFAEISKKNFREIPVIVPSDDLISRYCEIARTQYSAIELNLRNSNDLSEIRDSLLPKLLSGELEA